MKILSRFALLVLFVIILNWMQRCRFLNWRVVTGKFKYKKVKWKSVNSAGGTHNMSRIYREGQPSFNETWLIYNRVKNRLKTIRCLEEQCLYFVHYQQYFQNGFFFPQLWGLSIATSNFNRNAGITQLFFKISKWMIKPSIMCMPLPAPQLSLNVLEFYLLTNNSQKVWKGNYRLLGAICVKTTCSWRAKRSSSLFWEKRWKYICIN